MQPMPPMKLLLPFAAVAKHLSFTQAAEELCVTHSAISQNIKSLEDYFNKKLFMRTNHTVALTTDGQEFLQQIQEPLKKIQQATQSLLSNRTEAILTVNMLSSFVMYWLISHMQSFQSQYPQYELRLSSEWRHTEFQQEDVDVAVYYGDGEWPGLSSHLLFAEELAIFAKPELIPAKTITALADLAKHFKFLYVKANKRPDNFSLLFQQAQVPEPPQTQRIYFQNTMQALQAAINGLGLIAAHPQFIQDKLSSGILMPLPDINIKTGKNYYLVYPQERATTPKIKDFKEWILAEVMAGK